MTAQSSVRLLIAGGGTGGHVLPAVAVIEEFRTRQVDLHVLWIGSHGGVERSIAGAQNIPFVAVQTGKLRRYASLKTVSDAFRIPIGIAQAWRHVRAFKPDVIYSTGGAVSVPTALSGSRSAPVLTHEQTAQIGLSNRTLAKVAATFAVGFEDTALLARQIHDHVVLTGNPVRSSLSGGDRNRGFAAFGLTSELPVIYVTGGARGASPLNQRIEQLLPDLLEVVQIVHQVGPPSANGDLEQLSALKGTYPPHLAERYVVKDFITSELADLYAITALVIGRAGAGTISELAYLGLPSILIPLPGTWGDEQRKNARVLESAGGAVYLEQSDATPERLDAEVRSLILAPDRLREMAAASASISRPDASAKLVDELLALANQGR
ncbi:MAG: undecaprenyldiphospho-muramoylpentapeptide beta-N-acetylglucosaminyltransferase [Chloroflexia bacterium]|nr:undecaprenyldiphospho-muramoylpentapeptide beta-N-acetylglucosaminyltransferase [Chloroflexia bacterium]